MDDHISLFISQCVIEKFTKKLLGKCKIDKVEAVLQKLDRLTQEETRMAVTQTLGVVYGLEGNVRGVIEGTQRLPDLLPIFSECLLDQMAGRRHVCYLFILLFVDKTDGTFR